MTEVKAAVFLLSVDAEEVFQRIFSAVHKSSIRLSSLAASNREIIDIDTKHYLPAIIKTAIEKGSDR